MLDKEIPIHTIMNSNQLFSEVRVLFSDVVVSCGDVVGDFTTVPCEKVAVGLGDPDKTVLYHN